MSILMLMHIAAIDELIQEIQQEIDDYNKLKKEIKQEKSGKNNRSFFKSVLFY